MAPVAAYTPGPRANARVWGKRTADLHTAFCRARLWAGKNVRGWPGWRVEQLADGGVAVCLNPGAMPLVYACPIPEVKS